MKTSAIIIFVVVGTPPKIISYLLLPLNVLWREIGIGRNSIGLFGLVPDSISTILSIADFNFSLRSATSLRIKFEKCCKSSGRPDLRKIQT